MLELKNTTMKFDDFTALDDIDLAIAASASYGLLGPNGAGKSTILRLIAGVYAPFAGSVAVDGETIYDNPAAKQKIFFINDETVQFNRMTLRELHDFYKGFYPRFSSDAFGYLANLVGLPAKKKIEKFSKGMKRQAIVITGLAAQTEYLLLDEAFDGLDPAMRILVRKMITDAMKERGLTTIISSHNLSEIGEICQTVALIHQGKVQAVRDLNMLGGSLLKVQVAFKAEASKGRKRWGAFARQPKAQAVFDGEVSKDSFAGLDILKFERVQSVVYLVVKGEETEVRKKIAAMDPLLLDIIPLSLDEIFLYEFMGGGVAP